MAYGRKPTASEVLDVMDRLQRDPIRRDELSAGHRIFRVCVEEGLLNEHSIDWLAELMQELHDEGLIAYGSVHAGVIKPSVWDNGWLQSMADWRVTSSGRADAALYRRESGTISVAESAAPGQEHDLFISHAGEDKDTVARPLADELRKRGWKVWLDELELTVGDSLSSVIDDALARSRFGVVVLSRAFFAKPWPRRELEGLTAREVAAGSKVILPVWHEVDERYIVQKSPVLADRVGVSTSLDPAAVADKISQALERAGLRAAAGLAPEPVLQSVEPESRLTIPTTSDAQTRLVIERPQYWEYLLFAGVLVQGKKALEAKWEDYELRLPGGPRREVDQGAAPEFFQREMDLLTERVGALDRILAPAVWERAFGTDDEHADPARIENFALRIIKLYEWMLDWAAELRNTSVPSAFTEIRDVTARFVDRPLKDMRKFIDRVQDQIARLPELAAGGTVEQPVRLTLELKMEADPEVSEHLEKAWEKARQALDGT